MSRSLYLLDQDVGSLVVNWGEFEEIKEVLLAQAQMFVGQISVALKNSKGFFSPANPLGLLSGVNLYGLRVSLVFDGVLVYEGVLKDVEESYAGKTASLVIENVLTKAAESSVVLAGTALNPVTAVLGLLQGILPAASIDADRFTALAAQYTTQGAIVGCSFTADAQKTLLQAVQDISGLAGFSVFAQGGLITCRPGIPKESARQDLDGNTVKGFGSKHLAYTYFANQVNIGYGTGLIYTATDQGSVNLNGLKTYSFTTDNSNPLYVPDLASAVYFADLFLKRSAYIRTELTLDVDDAMMGDVTIGDVYTITAPQWYLTTVPFEVLEVHRDPKAFKIGLVLASLPA